MKKGENDFLFLSSHLDASQSVWYLNSGTTKHMAGRNEWLCKIQICNVGNIVLGDNTYEKLRMFFMYLAQHRVYFTKAMSNQKDGNKKVIARYIRKIIYTNLKA